MTLAVLDTDLLFDKIKFRKDVLRHYRLVFMKSKEGIQVSHILSTECGLEGMLVAPLVKRVSPDMSGAMGHGNCMCAVPQI